MSDMFKNSIGKILWRREKTSMNNDVSLIFINDEKFKMFHFERQGLSWAGRIHDRRQATKGNWISFEHKNELGPNYPVKTIIGPIHVFWWDGLIINIKAPSQVDIEEIQKCNDINNFLLLSLSYLKEYPQFWEKHKGPRNVR